MNWFAFNGTDINICAETRSEACEIFRTWINGRIDEAIEEEKELNMSYICPDTFPEDW